MTSRLASLLLAGAALCGAQDELPACVKHYRELVDKISAAAGSSPPGDVRRAVNTLINVRGNVSCFAQVAASSSAQSVLARAFEHVRTDQQRGTGPGGSGTTSLVARGVAARALGVAAEYGALTQSVKQQVVTLSGNLSGLPAALAKRNLFAFCDARMGPAEGCISSTLLRELRRFSFRVSFDTTRNAQTTTGTPAGAATPPAQPIPVVFRARGNEISSVSGRVELWNKRDSQSKAYQEAWAKAITGASELRTAAVALDKSMQTELAPVLRTPEYELWFRQAEAEMIRRAADAPEDLVKAWNHLLGDLLARLRAANPAFDKRMRTLRDAVQTFNLTEDEFIDSVATKPVLTFEYVNNRPVAQSSISVVRLIGDFGWAGKNFFIFNVGSGFYDTRQPAVTGTPAGRWRDMQLGGQYERRLGTLGPLGSAAVSGSGYFQYQRIPAVLDVDPAQPLPGISFVGLPEGARKVFAEKGNIVVVQTKLILGPEKTSARIPISVSWSNRTELINKPTWSAQVGVSYNFDALFAR